MEDFSYDPLCFWPSTIVDLIFQHLTVKEMMTASLVSTSWNEYIGESRSCMKRTGVKIIGRSHFLSGREKEIVESLRSLSASGRRYENFTHFAQRPGSGYLNSEVTNFLKSRTGKWKNVKIWSEKFSSLDDVRELWSSFNENVESLDLRNISIVDAQQSRQLFIPFKRLKTLSLCNVMYDSWFLNSFGDCRQLESLEVENVNDSALIQFIGNAESLKCLTISKVMWFDKLFDELSILPNLNIEEFKLKATHRYYPEDGSGMRRFLRVLAAKGTKITFDLPLDSDLRHENFNYPNFNIV